MKPTMVRVPGSLLLNRDVPESAKVLWMILRLHEVTGSAPISQRRLAVRYHLARNTILSGLTRLGSAGWLVQREPGGWVARMPPGVEGDLTASMPEQLLWDVQVATRAKVVYGSLQLTPGFENSSGRFTYAELAQLTGVSMAVVRHGIRGLVETGWLKMRQKNKISPIHFTLVNPESQRWEGEVGAAERRLTRAPFVGEALMREYLSLLIDSEEYDDDASPGFLVNPFTGEEMEFDRYYPPKAAFEFNGPQHYGPTAKYEDEESVRKQQARDYMKRGICESRGITLVIIHPEDLTLKNMGRKVGDLLPRRNLDGHARLAAFLESVSGAYRRKAGHWSRRRSLRMSL